MVNPDHPSLVTAEALDRFTRLRADTPTSAQLDELEHWLDASGDHRDAYEEVAAHWAAMESLRGDTALMFMRDAARRDLRRAQWGRATFGAVAASIAALAVFGATFLPGAYRAHAERQARENAQTYKTAVGEVSQVRLTDGTVATLDTNTVMRAWQVKDARFVELVQGRARFKVAKDAARPFSVLANGKSVTATGTDFDVYLKPNGLRVTLIEGRVHVATQGQGPNRPSVDMTPGYQLTASSSTWALAQADAASNLSWSRHQLTFDEATLREITDELNRYSSKKIVIKDARIASLRMSAVIRATDSRSFLGAVEELSMAHVQDKDGVFEIVPR
jgi:transmembrane sensor